MSNIGTSMEFLVIDKKARHRRPKAGGKLVNSIKDYFYTNDDFGGRNWEGWFKIFLFYWCFYWALAVFSVLLFSMFYLTIDKNNPRYTHEELYRDRTFEQLKDQGPNKPKVYSNVGLLLPNPGMGFRPVPDLRSTLVRFVQGRPSSYKFYTDDIQAYLEKYEDGEQEGEAFIDCDNLPDGNRDKEKVCRFKIEWLGGDCTKRNDFGYDDGQPCILLKLNKVHGWEPVPFANNNTAPPDIWGRWDQSSIGISCEGEGPLDKENIGPIKYWPETGFPNIYYPYLNQEGYRQPLVVIKFMKPANGVVINVWCRAWAKNIRHHREDRTGSIHFELLVD